VVVCNLTEAQEQQLVARRQLQVVGDSDLPDRESRHPAAMRREGCHLPGVAKTAA
jgi:hypothetical protein